MAGLDDSKTLGRLLLVSLILIAWDHTSLSGKRSASHRTRDEWDAYENGSKRFLFLCVWGVHHEEFGLDIQGHT